MTEPDRIRVARFVQVLAAPFDLDGQRGSRLTQPGRADRYDTVLKPLLVRWAQRRQIDRGLDTGASPARKVLAFPARRRA